MRKKCEKHFSMLLLALCYAYWRRKHNLRWRSTERLSSSCILPLLARCVVCITGRRLFWVFFSLWLIDLWNCWPSFTITDSFLAQSYLLTAFCSISNLSIASPPGPGRLLAKITHILSSQSIHTATRRVSQVMAKEATRHTVNQEFPRRKKKLEWKKKNLQGVHAFISKVQLCLSYSYSCLDPINTTYYLLYVVYEPNRASVYMTAK